MKKRIFALLMAFIMLVGALPFTPVSAASRYDADGDGEVFVLEAESKTINENDSEVTVDINILENSGVWAFKFYLVYDKELTVGSNEAFTEGTAFPGFDPNGNDVGSVDMSNAMMIKSDADYTKSVENAGLTPDSNWLVTTIYTECSLYGDICTDTGLLCSVNFGIDPDSDKDSYSVYAIPAISGWILRDDPDHINANRYGLVEIYDPVCVYGVITVDDGSVLEPELPEVSYKPMVTVSDATIVEGEESAEFTLSITNNTGIWSALGYISYDDAASLLDFENGEIFADEELVFDDSMDSGAEQMKDIVVANDDNVKAVYEEVGASYEGVLATKVYFEPTTFDLNTKNGVLVTFSLNTAALEVGTYEIAYYFDEYGFIDNDGNPVEFAMVAGTLTVLACAHEYDAGVEVPATCTVPGTLTKTCTLCGAPDVTEIPALEHTFDAGVETAPATCTVEGTMTFTCTRNCGEEGHTYTEAIPALNHTFDAGVVTTPAECGVDGVMTYTCTRNCGEEGHTYTEAIPALTHNYVAGTPVPPTCTVEGYTVYTCDLCGDFYNDDIVPALDHTFDAGVVTTPAQCEIPGVMTYTCTRNCGEEGHTYTEAIPALEHDKYVTGTSGTCGEVGVTHWGCHLCSWEDSVDGEVIVHDYEEVVGSRIPATCTVDGSVKFECSICGDDYTDILGKLEHTFDAGVETAPATCTVDGVMTYTCTRNCEETGWQYTEAIPALEHTFDAGVETAPATCTVPGTMTFTCTRNCGEEGHTYTEAIPVLEHTFDAGVVTTPAECGVDGVMTYTCTRNCEEAGWKYTEVIPALEHDTELVNVVPVKCTTNGYTGDEVCNLCGTTIVPGSVIPKLEHAFDAGVVTTPAECGVDGVMTYTCTRNCEEAGWKYTEVIPALEHNYVAGEPVGPTCEDDGYTTYTCDLCGDSYNGDIVPALEHDEVMINVAPGCLEDGYTVTICDRCGVELTERSDVVPAHGHDYVAGEPVEPTCEDDGYTTYTCSHCGDSYEADFVEAEGHQFDNGVITTAPTTEAEGEKTYTCEVCGETKTEAVAKLEASDKEEDKEEDKAEDKEETKPEENKKPTSDQTGDNVMALVLIALVAVVSLAGVVISKKKLFSNK